MTLSGLRFWQKGKNAVVEGVAEFRRFMYTTLPQAVQNAAREALEQGADELVEAMRRLVPVDKGNLRDSIGWAWDRAPAGAVYSDGIGGSSTGGMRIVIFAGSTEGTKRLQRRDSGTRTRDQGREGYFEAENARYQEFGTSNMAANPFFYPAYRALRRKVKSRITRSINKAIRSL